MEDFQKLTFDAKVTYLVDNLRSLPDDLAEEGVDILVRANETEYAVVLAREKGMTDRAIKILVDAGDYLWAALIARNAGDAGRSTELYREGLQYYVDMEMYGRAISAATALNLPGDLIDDLFRRGVEHESRGRDMGRIRAMIDSGLESLEIASIGKDDDISREMSQAIKDERDRMAAKDRKDIERA